MKRRRLLMAAAVACLLAGAAAPVAARDPQAGNSLGDSNPSPPPPARYIRAEDALHTQSPTSCPSYEGVPGLGVDAQGNPYIANVQEFLDTCPQSDPNLPEILNDFQIRQDDVLVTDFPCTEPVSQMPAAQYTDPLIALQVLRAMYYMDRGQVGHLPWTPGSLYDWMKAKIGGIDIVTGVSGGYCCVTIDGRVFFVGGPHDDSNREFDKTWDGISNLMAFYAHERRHMDGNGYPHSSCCGITNGCDDSYDPSDLTPYGVQWWLEMSWLEGDINVGVGCLAPDLISQDAQWHLANANEVYRPRFCYTQPPLLTMPDQPGGRCRWPVMAISPTTLPGAVIGTPYSQTLTASGGTPPYDFSLAGGSLPPGWDLSSGGTLAGTASSAGTFAFTVTAADAAGCSTSEDYSLAASAQPPSIASVRKAGNPFRLIVEGADFHPSALVFIDGTQAPSVQVKKPTKIVAKGGKALKAMVPEGATVTVTVQNPDDGGVSAPFSFTR
jgi:hypothetical protein